MNPFDPYGLYTNPNQLGVGANIIGDASTVMARNPNVAAQMPQQPTSGLLASGPNMLKPTPMMEEEKVDGAGFQGLADAFMKKDVPTDYSFNTGGISEPGLKMPEQTGGNAMVPNYDFQAQTNFGLDPLNSNSGLGLFLNKFGF